MGNNNPFEEGDFQEVPNYKEHLERAFEGTEFQDASQNEPYEEQRTYTEPAPQYRPEEPAGFAIASLVLGIISLISSCLGINIIFSILSIVFGALHLSRRNSRRGMALAGIILSVISIVVFVALVALGLHLIAEGFGGMSSEIFDEIYKQL